MDEEKKVDNFGGGMLQFLPNTASETMCCPQCGAAAWDEARARSGAVAQCPGCWYRVAYGEVMPRCAVAPDGPFAAISLSHFGNPMQYEYRIDQGLALMLALNLASILPEGARIQLAQKILATVHV